MSKQYELFFGRLGADPELLYTGSGKAVCRLSIGVNVDGEEKVNWRKVVAWERQAENCSALLKKGHKVFIQGQSVKKEYTGKDGEIRESEEVTAWDVGFIHEQ